MRKIFLSYCWKDEKYADLIDEYFQKVGIKLIRDRRDLAYSNSISAFAKKIRKTSFAICIISDDFLKKENCMYEIVEFQKDDNFSKKICPIVINYPNKSVDLQPESIEHYANFWNNEITKQNNLINNIHDNTKKEEHIVQLKKYTSIYNGIRSFLFFLKDAIYLPNESIDSLGIRIINENIFKKIGISPKISINELYAITQEITIEDAEHHLARYMSDHLIKENEYYFYTRANVYEKFGYYDLALYNFKLALKTAKDFVLAYESIIMLYMKGIYDIDSFFSEIILCLENVDETNITLKMAKGLLYLKDGEDSYAINMFETALESASNNKCYIYNNLAISYENLKEIVKAEMYYKKAIEENESYYQAYNNMALLYLVKFKNTEKALITIKKCLEIYPSYYMGLNTLGLIQEEEKNFNEALSNYLRAFHNGRSKKNFSAPLNNIGRILDFEFKDKMCKVYYELAYNLNPKSLVCIFNLGNCYRKYFHDYEESYKYLNMARDMQPNNILCNMALGLLEYNKGEYAIAIDYFSFAYLCDKSYGPSCLSIGLCMSKLGESTNNIINVFSSFEGRYEVIEQLHSLQCVSFNESELIDQIEYDYINVSTQIVKTVFINPIVQIKDSYQYITDHFFD